MSFDDHPHVSPSLYTCHLLGAYLQRNVTMKIAKSVPTLRMCDPPEQFNVDIFFNKGLLHMVDGEVYFYKVGKAEATVKAEGSTVTDAATLEWKKEIGAVRNEMGEIKTGLATLTSTILGLKEPLGVYTNIMTEALVLMMRMVTFVEQEISQPQQSSPPGTFLLKSVSSSQAVMPVKKWKESTTTTTTNIQVRKEIPRPLGQKAKTDDAPPLPPKKSNAVAQKPGPHGDQSQS